jgi:hypothetical protein
LKPRCASSIPADIPDCRWWPRASDEDGRIIGWAEQVKAVSHFNRRLIAASEEEHR